MTATSSRTVVVAPRGVGRLRAGHPWVFRSDIRDADGAAAGLARLVDERGKGLGTALYCPASEIRARWLAPYFWSGIKCPTVRLVFTR